MSRRKNRKISLADQRKALAELRPRNPVVLQMITHVKGGSMMDRKKERNKKLCRRPVVDE